MKKLMTAALIALLMAMGALALDENYQTDGGNAENFVALLKDLVEAYEQPSDDDAARIDADLAAIGAVSAPDGEVAASIADHWRAVYLDPGYALNLYDGGEYAAVLEGSGISNDASHAFVVLGYELKDGRMTDELKGRCDAAAAAARMFPNTLLVCSGGATGKNNPDRHTEAGMMRAYLVKKCGIDASRILIDEEAMTTVDNALNTYRMLSANGVRTMTIVTSSYHQRWGQAVYNAVGALYWQENGYRPEIVSNYCFDIEPSRDMYRRDDRIAARQMANVLKIPKEVMEAASKK